MDKDERDELEFELETASLATTALRKDVKLFQNRARSLMKENEKLKQARDLWMAEAEDEPRHMTEISDANGVLMMEVTRLRSALEEISNLHCQYEKAGQYEIGVVDGHRCAAAVASKALIGEGETTTPTDVITDGHGGRWSRTCPRCGKDTMHVVRPGEVQCRECG